LSAQQSVAENVFWLHDVVLGADVTWHVHDPLMVSVLHSMPLLGPSGVMTWLHAPLQLEAMHETSELAASAPPSNVQAPPSAH